MSHSFHFLKSVSPAAIDKTNEIEHSPLPPPISESVFLRTISPSNTNRWKIETSLSSYLDNIPTTATITTNTHLKYINDTNHNNFIKKPMNLQHPINPTYIEKGATSEEQKYERHAIIEEEEEENNELNHMKNNSSKILEMYPNYSLPYRKKLTLKTAYTEDEDLLQNISEEHSNQEIDFNQYLIQHGFQSYINEFETTGITSLIELIQFATQYLPPAICVTPCASTADKIPGVPPLDDEELLQLNDMITCSPSFQFDINTDADDEKYVGINVGMKSQQNTNMIKNETSKKKKRKNKFYEADALLGEDEFCEYALLIRDAGNDVINGYYTCTGYKNEYLMFNNMKDIKAALYQAKNHTWFIVYDDEYLYANPLKSDMIGGRDILLLSNRAYDPPPTRCWYSVEGTNPPPGVMWIEITENPMCFMDEQKRLHFMEHNQNQDYQNQFIEDMPVIMLEFMFVGAIGFALRVDEENKRMEVIRIKDGGQAKDLGLFFGDRLLKINEEDVSEAPEIAFAMLKESVQSEEAFEVTFLRKRYEELVINVERGGMDDVNGSYYFLELDEIQTPVFVQEKNPDWFILRLDHDEDEGHSIWGIQLCNIFICMYCMCVCLNDRREGEEYYVGYSDSYSPPNNAWETVNDGKDPAPGLRFTIVNKSLVRKWVDDSPSTAHHMFVPQRNRRQGPTDISGSVELKMDDDELLQMTTMGDFQKEIMKQKKMKVNVQSLTSVSVTNTPKMSNTIINRGRSWSVANSPSPSIQHPRMLSTIIGGIPSSTRVSIGRQTTSDNIPSTQHTHNWSSASNASVANLVLNDDITVALLDYQLKVTELECVLKEERKRNLTLTYKHKTKQTMLESDVNATKKHVIELQKNCEIYKEKNSFYADQLTDVNHDYWRIYIKQWDSNLEMGHMSREIQKMRLKSLTTRRQLFQSKREVEELETNIDELRIEYEEKLETAENLNRENMFHEEKIAVNAKDFELLDLQTDIISLKSELAAKEIRNEELRAENMQWQSANDSVFQQMIETQKRLASENVEFEAAKKYYESKLTNLRDKIQDYDAQFWEYDKHMRMISKLYESETNKKLPVWECEHGNKKLFAVDEIQRLSIDFIAHQIRLSHNVQESRDSFVAFDDGDHDTEIAINLHLNHHDSEIVCEESSDGNIGAFGVFDDSDDDDDEEDEDDEEDDEDDDEVDDVISPF